MRIEKIAREKTGLFSSTANRLVYNQEELTQFLGAPFDLTAFENQITQKKANYSAANRAVLTQVIASAYAQMDVSEKQKENVSNLAKENAFTVTTGHQLSLLTGPLYFIIKILHVVNLTQALKKRYPNEEFIPLFWMASEDHDFAEINSVSLFQKEIQWETDQKGPVGQFELKNWEAFREQIKVLFQNQMDSEVMDLIHQYNGKTLGEATFNLINALFRQYGVLVLDADQHALKKLFSPIIEQELLSRKSQKAVELQNKRLQTAGISGQAHAREINLFLLGEQSRERIQTDGEDFFVEGTGKIAKGDMLDKLSHHPEQFSPNVILRPLYQECILPNLCYVGGGGEIAYWLQLKAVFDEYRVPFPLIQVRNSLMILDESTAQKMESVHWSTHSLFEDLDQMKKEFVLHQSDGLDFNDLREKQMQLISAARKLTTQVDKNMLGFIEAEMTRFSKQIESIEQKLVKAEKAKFEKPLKWMEQIKEKVFPKGGLQERSTNFFQFCADGKVTEPLERLRLTIDPFEKDFSIIHFYE